jgi:hypothetical protein
VRNLTHRAAGYYQAKLTGRLMVETIFPEGYTQPPQMIASARISLGFKIYLEGGQLILRIQNPVPCLQERHLDLLDPASAADIETRIDYTLEHLPQATLDEFESMFNDEVLLLTMKGSPTMISQAREVSISRLGEQKSKAVRRRLKPDKTATRRANPKHQKEREAFLKRSIEIIQNRYAESDVDWRELAEIYYEDRDDDSARFLSKPKRGYEDLMKKFGINTNELIQRAKDT